MVDNLLLDHVVIPFILLSTIPNYLVWSLNVPMTLGIGSLGFGTRVLVLVNFLRNS